MTQRGLKHQSLLELIASCPPSRPRNGAIVGWFQQIATTAIVPFNTDPDSSNNPELNCVFPLHNDFDFASLEWLEGVKVDHIKPHKTASSSPMATVQSFSFSVPQKRYLHPAEGAR